MEKMVKKIKLCGYGCGREAKFSPVKSRTKWCCSESFNSCPEMRRKNSVSLLGEKNPMFGKKRPEVSEWMKNGGAVYVNSFVTKEGRRRQLEWMKGGGATYLLSFVKNISNPQIAIHENVKVLFPNLTVIINYPFLSYSLDVVILEFKIVIEYDGFPFHDDSIFGDTKKDLERQKECEKYGWKFIRYKGTRSKDIVPTLEQVKEDIKEVLICSN